MFKYAHVLWRSNCLSKIHVRTELLSTWMSAGVPSPYRCMPRNVLKQMEGSCRPINGWLDLHDKVTDKDMKCL